MRDVNSERLIMEGSKNQGHFVKVNGVRLHYLDWGGVGPVLLFLTGMGCSAYIFDEFAQRFTDSYHVIALDRRGHGDSDYPESGYDADTLTEDLRQFLDALGVDQVILVGHSMGYIELTHFAALYPQRVLNLIYLDAAYDRTLPGTQAIWDQNPLSKMIPPWPEVDPDTIEEYIATLRRLYPALDVVWGPVMEEQTRHTVVTSADGKIVDRMSASITKACNDAIAAYVPEYGQVRAPTLSFFSIRDGCDYLSSEYMTEEQKDQVIGFFQTVLQTHQQKDLAQFRRNMPQAKVVEIPHGHHYCFIKQEELVYAEMRRFLDEETASHR